MQPQHPSERRLSLPTKTAFGVGQMAEGIKNNALNVFALFYYNQVLELPGTLAGLALGIAIVFDAITDPICGALSDRTHTRWGRRHPYMVGAAVPLGLSFFLLFSPPAGLGSWGPFTWLTVSAVMVRTAMTAYFIPHLALGAEMASNYDDRSSVFAFSTIFGYLGGITSIWIGYTVFFPSSPDFTNGLLNGAAYPRYAGTFAIVMAGAILLCAYGTRKEIPYLPVGRRASARLGLRTLSRELTRVFRFGPFRSIFTGLFLAALVLSIDGVFNTYMGVHFWDLSTEELRWIPLGAMGGLPLSLPLTGLFTRWFDKRNAIVISAVALIVAGNTPVVLRLLGVPWFPANGHALLLPILISVSFVSGVLGPVIFATLNSIFADI
jgi:Na+/melibiose symporter-like transporter